jgi:CBS domain-containing protein
MKGHSTVADVMTSDVVTVGPNASFRDIVAIVEQRHVSAVPVVDEDRHVLGVVSETDLLRKEEYLMPWRSRRLARRGDRADRAKANGTVASELMTSPAICVGLGTSLPTAARLMTDHDITRVVVVSADGTLAGIVSRSDLLRVFLGPDDDLRDRVVRRLIRHALWDDPFAVSVTVANGIVTLNGELERRSRVDLAVRFARTVDGVVDVVNDLSYIVDDTGHAVTTGT